MEEHYGPFLEPQAYSAAWIQEKVVPSPWSGKKIDLGSYTHAIAVWYGLAQFWLKARVTTEHELKPAVVDQMIQQASYGFLKERNVHLAAEERFLYLNKDYLSFSLGFQPEIAKQLRENAIA